MSVEHRKCPNKNCDAHYEVSVFPIGSRTREHHECDACGEVLLSGKSSKIYTFRRLPPAKP